MAAASQRSIGPFSLSNSGSIDCMCLRGTNPPRATVLALWRGKQRVIEKDHFAE